MQQPRRGLAVSHRFQQRFGALRVTGEREAELGLEARRRGAQCFEQNGFGRRRIYFAQDGGAFLPEPHRFFRIGNDFGERGEMCVRIQRGQGLGRGGARVGGGALVVEQAGQFWLQPGQAQSAGQLGGCQLPFVHLVGNDRGQGDHGRVEAPHGQPRGGMAAVAIHDFQAAFPACEFAQIPMERLRGVTARRRAVRENLLGVGVAQANQVLLALRFVGRSVVTGHKKAQPGGDNECFGAQDAGELFAAG